MELKHNQRIRVFFAFTTLSVKVCGLHSSKVALASLVISDAISVATSAANSDANFQNCSLLALALARISLAKQFSLIANHFAHA